MAYVLPAGRSGGVWVAATAAAPATRRPSADTPWSFCAISQRARSPAVVTTPWPPAVNQRGWGTANAAPQART
ncbi:hypothetical protein ADL22_25580 [Streptomyces sp. NRRL F-4489]|nr:hypothetical protein ADL22_25580 [Streptomyces sp. NRRL F-4489]